MGTCAEFVSCSNGSMNGYTGFTLCLHKDLGAQLLRVHPRCESGMTSGEDQFERGISIPITHLCHAQWLWHFINKSFLPVVLSQLCFLSHCHRCTSQWYFLVCESLLPWQWERHLETVEAVLYLNFEIESFQTWSILHGSPIGKNDISRVN